MSPREQAYQALTAWREAETPGGSRQRLEAVLRACHLNGPAGLFISQITIINSNMRPLEIINTDPTSRERRKGVQKLAIQTSEILDVN